MGGCSPRVVVRACALILMMAVLSGSALVGSAPRARADHETVPWSTPQPVNGMMAVGLAASVVDSGSHTLYGVWQDPLNGTLYANLTFIAESDGTPFGGPGVRYASSPNDRVGGLPTAWVAPAEGLAADSQGRVYVAWIRGPDYTGGASSDIDVSASLDRGHTWPTIARASAADDLGNDYFPVVQAAPDGRVWVAYFQTTANITSVTVAESSDHGATFQGHWNITTLPLYVYGQGLDFQIDGQGRLHLVYSVCSNSSCTLGYAWSDSGSTWSPPVALLKTSPSGPSLFVYDPSLAIAGSTLNVAWLDSRQTPTGWDTQYYARSTDRGATWAVPVPISQGTSEPFVEGARIAAFGETVMAVWGSSAGFSWAVSATGGATWSPEVDMSTNPAMALPMMTVDRNGTFHVMAAGYLGGNAWTVDQSYWDGPPDAPSGLAATSPAANAVRLTWAAPPEADVVAYDVWRSADGSSYSLTGTVGASNTSWTDTGLANGSYWYKVTAVDATSHMSHDSLTVAAYVGPSPQPPSNALQNELDQILASQTLLTVLLIVVLVVVAVETFLLLRSGRRPKGPASAPSEPKHPEDEL